MANTRSAAPFLPAISQSPLLSGDLGIPSDLFATLAGPLPTITIGSSLATFDTYGGLVDGSRNHYPDRTYDKPRSKPSSPLRSPVSPLRSPASPASSTSTSSSTSTHKEICSLLDLLEDMQNDITSEVKRVRRSIQETRTLVRAYREDAQARETARQQRLRVQTERRMAGM